SRGGTLLENGRREQVYKGLFLTLNKRLANRWMLRGNVTWQDWRWRIPRSGTNDPNPALLGGLKDGSLVVSGHQTIGGAFGNVFSLRVEKEVRIKNAGVTFGFDLFNALNSATVLQRQSLLGRSNGDYVLEVLGQRVYRLSLRIDVR